MGASVGWQGGNDDTMTMIEPDRLLTRDSLEARAAQVAEYMETRTTLSDGSLGYRVSTRGVIGLRASATDADAPVEMIEVIGHVCELRVPDPTLTMDGSLRFDYEMSHLVAEGVSRELFPMEVPIRVLVGRGVDPLLRPSLGRLEVPAGVTFGLTPIDSLMEVHMVAETPFGRFQNREPARMVARMTSIPPVGQTFEQQGIVALYNEKGDACLAKVSTQSTVEEPFTP